MTTHAERRALLYVLALLVLVTLVLAALPGPGTW
jgi:hypothetical protein